MKKEISIGAGQTSIIIEEMKGTSGDRQQFIITLSNKHGYVHTAYMSIEGLEDLGPSVQKYFQEFMIKDDEKSP